MKRTMTTSILLAAVAREDVIQFRRRGYWLWEFTLPARRWVRRFGPTDSPESIPPGFRHVAFWFLDGVVPSNELGDYLAKKWAKGAAQ